MSVVANVAINVDSRDAVSKLRQVQSQAQITERAFEALNNAVAAFGAGFAITKIIDDVKELDTNLRRLGTVGGDVKALDKGLGNLSKNLNGIVNKAELAAASYQALSAGFTDTAGNLKLVEAATKAAIGGMADTTQVVEVLTKTLNAYGMSGADAVKVTDSISKAIEYGQVEWSDYTSQLGRVASVAAIAGISLDEVNAFIAAATKNGATAEIAFTGLGAAIQTILQPTKESQEAAKALGIQWNLTGLQAKGFNGLLADLAKKQDTNKEAAARLLGSQEAMRGIFAANAKAGKDYQMILAGLQGAAGKTQSDFDQMKVSLENQLKALDTAFKNLNYALGGAFGPTIVGVVKNLADAINIVADAINAIPQPVKIATGELIKLIAQMLLLQKAIQAIIGLRAAFVATMTGMAVTTAATGTAAKTSASAFALYTSNTQALQAQAAAATPVMAGLLATLRNLAALGVITVGINLVVTGLQQAIAANVEINKLRGEREAGGVAKSFGGTATADQKEQARKTLAAINAERQRLAQPSGVIARTVLGALAPLAGQLTPSAVAERNLLLRAREQKAQAILGLPTRAETTGTNLPNIPSNPYDPNAGKEKKPRRKSLDELIGGDIKRTLEARQALNELQTAQRMGGAGTEQAKRMVEFISKYRSIAIEILAINETIAKVEAQRSVLQANGINVEEKLRNLNAERRNLVSDLNVQLQTQYNQATEAETERLKLVGELLSKSQYELELARQKDPLKRAELQIDQQLKSDAVAKLNLTEAQLKALRETLLTTERLKIETTEVDEIFTNLANTTANAFGNAIDAITDSTKTLNESLGDIGRQMLVTISKMLLMYGIAQGLGALGGGNKTGFFSTLAGAFGFKPRANGGPVAAGSPYIVGERGPELFVPGRSGTIVPNDKMGGNSVQVGSINISVENTGDTLSPQAQKQIAGQVRGIVLATLVDQQRGGGVLR